MHNTFVAFLAFFAHLLAVFTLLHRAWKQCSGFGLLSILLALALSVSFLFMHTFALHIMLYLDRLGDRKSVV